ncbi:RNA polymerase Rpb4 [Candidatus Woesearchaeota archaeon]|nr:RNA polymerase Rpb4 [Candidatus Woesearchaeota archaeon]
MKAKIVTEAPITMSEVKEVLAAAKEKEGELNFRAAKTGEYLQQFASLSAKDAKKLIDELTELSIPRVRETALVKLADILPKTPKDVKVVLQSFAITVTNENIQKLADTIAKYA